MFFHGLAVFAFSENASMMNHMIEKEMSGNIMSISSTRAQAVAEILWELKKAKKLATLTSIADRAGFSPGSGGRTVSTCLRMVRRDWPHLQWWRAVADNGQLEKEQESYLVEAGFETETGDGDTVVIKSLAEQLMNWEGSEDAQDGGDPSSSEQR